MLSDKFTLLELLDLALRVPEVGAVNFNILHTVLTCLVIELQVDDLKPICHIEDEVMAQAAITKGRMEDPNIKRRASQRPVKSVHELKGMLQAADLQKLGMISVPQSADEKQSVEDIQDKSSTVQEDESAKDEFSQAHLAGPSDKDIEEESPVLKEGKESRDEEKSSVSETKREDDQVKPTDSTETKSDGTKTGDEYEDKSLEESEKQDAAIKEPDKKSSREVQIQTEKLGDEEKDEAGASKLKISVPDLTEQKNLAEVTDKEKAAEVRAVAEDILEKTSDGKTAAKEILEGTREETVEKVATHALKVLTDEDIFDEDPARVVQDMWRAININRRMDGAEEGLRELSSIVDFLLDKIQEVDLKFGKSKDVFEQFESFLERVVQLEKESVILQTQVHEANEFTKVEAVRLEELIDELRSGQDVTNVDLTELETAHRELKEEVAYKQDVEELKTETFEIVETKAKELKKKIFEVEDKLIPKEQFVELVSRADTLEEVKVNRDELGRLMEPGYLEDFLNEQENLRRELNELKIGVSNLEENFNAFVTKIEEEILKSIEASFSEVNLKIEDILSQLDKLDADDINDTFARLEDQLEDIIKEIELIKETAEMFEKECRVNFKRIADVISLIKKLEGSKADKTNVRDLLELKADVEYVNNKLDRSEFVSVINEVQDDLGRLTLTVKINEEEMHEAFIGIRHEISFKMYTEDFIIGTEPIRNRIKAILYEQERLKELFIKQFFPDAPGVVKCFSCKRAANIAGAKLNGSSISKHTEETSGVTKSKSGNKTPTKSSSKESSVINATKSFSKESSDVKNATKSSSKESSDVKNATKSSSKESSDVKLPPLDLDSVPIPPADKPRIKDILQLPVLFANARPQVGLAHEKRKRDIDHELDAYLASGKFISIGGEYTKTFPQQHGLSFTTVTLPKGKKTEVLLQGLDNRYYKGALYDAKPAAGAADSSSELADENAKSETQVNRDYVEPSAVILKTSSKDGYSTTTLPIPITRSKTGVKNKK